MAHERSKFQLRKNRALVREILMRDWDPIGVAGEPEAADEYDTCVAKAYVMLMDQCATADAISAYLFEIATKHMGIPESADLVDRSDRVARILVSMRPDFETH